MQVISNRVFRKELPQIVYDAFEILASLKSSRPSAARVENIPVRHATLVAAFSWIVIPKPYDHVVP